MARGIIGLGNGDPTVVVVIKDGELKDVVSDRPMNVVWADYDAPRDDRVYRPAHAPDPERLAALLLGTAYDEVYGAHERARHRRGRPDLRVVHDAAIDREAT